MWMDYLLPILLISRLRTRLCLRWYHHFLDQSYYTSCRQWCVNKDLTFKDEDKDKDQTFKAKDQDKD